MTEVTTAVDWSQAQVTTSAKNAKDVDRLRVVRVPRKVFDRYWPMPWAELEQSAARGDGQCELWLVTASDAPPADTAYMREGRKAERSIAGLSLLYRQGW